MPELVLITLPPPLITPANSLPFPERVNVPVPRFTSPPLGPPPAKPLSHWFCPLRSRPTPVASLSVATALVGRRSALPPSCKMPPPTVTGPVKLLVPLFVTESVPEPCLVSPVVPLRPPVPPKVYCLAELLTVTAVGERVVVRLTEVVPLAVSSKSTGSPGTIACW